MSSDQLFYGAAALFGLSYIYIIHPMIKTKEEERIAEHFRGLDGRLAEIERRSKTDSNSGNESPHNV